MTIHQIPENLNIEQIISYLPEGSFKVAFKGLHKRNAYNDIVDIEPTIDDTMMIGIARNSIYNSLPEYIFHSIDRFSNLPRSEEKERFAEELEKETLEKESALRFFAPIDLQFLKYRTSVSEELRTITESNSVLANIIGDNLTKRQLDNSFIKKTIPFLPSCKIIRGNKTLLTLLLRKIFMDEEMVICPRVCKKEFKDDLPRYAASLGNQLDSTFVGNTYDEMAMTYDIVFWPERVDADFLNLVEEIELFRRFVQDYFLSIEEILCFNISDDAPALRLSDDEEFNWLNYNTNL